MVILEVLVAILDGLPAACILRSGASSGGMQLLLVISKVRVLSPAKETGRPVHNRI